ncbi:hypothetical protein ISG33_04415 [Glaciecola sp. MH2013]|uniref:hypothetical protein n=1 Tax=Glaciecola sp. MH2013 TaxID=2785524 RepID=UPI00189D64C2|nr:hypothetical protein [Glaciecola sp. MH2013]MBF7072641.1 hypothetical protein [Glaciecola sp. MH2013]
MSESSSELNKTFNKRLRNIYILLVIGLASLLIRLLISYEFDKTALLYVGIPFLVALALLSIVEKPEKPSLHHYYLHIVLWSLIVMLGTSIVLFEGIICVVMFMPIYFAIIFLMYLFELLVKYLNHTDKNKHYAHVLPVLIVMSAFEGVIPSTSFNRDYSVTKELIVNSTTAEIKHKLTQPMQLEVERNWLLSLFPMPSRIDAGTLKSGDIHTIDFVYHRWFVTNTHKGNMILELSSVEQDYIQTTFLEDSSYIGNYLRLRGTEIRFTPIEDGSTKVILTIHYHRFLDPVWYFGPLQEYAIGQTASLLLEELFVPAKG